MNTELLYRFIQGLCDQAETQEVQRLLEQDPAFKAEYEILKSLDQGAASYSYTQSNKAKAWEEITVETTPTVIPMYKQNWFRAAAMLVVLFTAVLIFKNGDTDKDILTIKANQQGEMFDLPDGSKVWLQLGSELNFYDNQEDNIREATLTGVGFFVVKPNDNKKFEVTNSHLKVLVLGTAFEMTDQMVHVDHGTVQVTASHLSDTAILHEHDMVQVDKHSLTTKSNQAEVALWRNESLKFKNQPLSQIVSSVENHYQIKVIFDESLLQESFTLDFEGLELEEVMLLLETVTNTKYKFSNQEYRFKR